MQSLGSTDLSLEYYVSCVFPEPIYCILFNPYIYGKKCFKFYIDSKNEHFLAHSWFVIWGFSILSVFDIMKLNGEDGTIEKVSEWSG